MNKHLVFLLVFFGCFLTFCSCGKEHPEMSNQQQPNIEGFTINNEPLDYDDTAYSIDELDMVFSHNLSDRSMMYLEDINQHFLIEHLRKVENHESYYIVYPVREGGKYLIFLNSVLDPTTGRERLCFDSALSNALYVHNLPDEDDFDVLNSGNTFEDVKKVAPCTQLILTRSSSIESYSMLNNGNVMMCSYRRMDEHFLLLESMSVILNNDISFPYAGMVPSDLVD